jgi:hydrogenase expression/formation protein HypE
VLEEGLPIADLRRIVASMRDACAAARGHARRRRHKVRRQGQADGCFITTTGLGVVPAGRQLSIAAARPGDRILVSGDDRRPRRGHPVGA